MNFRFPVFSFSSIFALGFFLTVPLAPAQETLKALTPTQSQPSAETTTTAAAQESPERTAALQGAADLFNKRDFAGTLERLKEICASDPKLPPPRIIMAQWFAQARLPDGIRASLDAATAETPGDPEAYLLLGEIALRQRELTASALLFDQGGRLLNAYEANPERKKIMQISLLRNLTILAEIREDWKRMETLVDARIAFEGKTPELLRTKAVALFRQNRDEESGKLLAEADTLDAKSEKKGLPAEAVLSQLYLSRGDKDRGRSFLNAALGRYPNSKEVLSLSVMMRLSDEDLAGARQLAEKLYAEDRETPSFKQLLATIALFQEDYATAEKLFQELIIVSPTDIQSANGLALALCEQNDPAKLRRALEYAAENVRRNNRNSELLGTLGWVLYKANDLNQATGVLQQAAAQGNISPQTAYYMAKIEAQNGNADTAKQLLDAALKSNTPFAKKRETKQLLDELNKAPK